MLKEIIPFQLHHFYYKIKVPVINDESFFMLNYLNQKAILNKKTNKFLNLAKVLKIFITALFKVSVKIRLNCNFLEN